MIVFSGDRERLREAHARDRAENDQLRKRVESSKKCIAKVTQFCPYIGALNDLHPTLPFFLFPLRCDGRDMDFASLTKAHHALRVVIDNAQKEAEQAKNLANNALAGTYHSPCFYS